MALVGIIANPASGKDIRRLVAHALTIGNREKANIVRRMLIGLHAVGIQEVYVMPDNFGIGAQAIHDLRQRQPDVISGVTILDMDFAGSPIDSTRAARSLREMGAGCLITLGGDGTARMVAKGCAEVPLLPVSTGTNNVLPQFIEGTLAGLAAGLVAQHGQADREQVCYRSKRLDVWVNGEIVDLALVDVAAVASAFAGSRAIWEPGMLRQIAVTRASPASIGLSAVVGLLQPISLLENFGAITTISANGLSRKVLAPVGPGLMAQVPVQELIILEPNHPYPLVGERPLMLALDGEREITLQPGDEAALILRTDGPWIVDADRVLESATRNGWFISQAD